MRNVKKKFIRQAATITSACLILTGSPWQAAQGQQRPTSLFSNSCIVEGSGSRASGNDVVINREIFTEVYYITDGTSVTCRIRPAGSEPRYGTLRLAFGRSDSEIRGTNIQVVVYLDGTRVVSRTLSPSDRTFVVLDVSRASSISIETSSARTGRVQSISFTQALLEPLSLSPGQR